MTANWRRYRPAIWLSMLGIALILVLNPPYIGAALLGAGIGIGLRIWRRPPARGAERPARRRPPGG
ncbi:MAG TPA: hypothetical protein VKT31_09745 [Solirubrobacteraceae bacterium]|nr:hypothetical protein [Solirubrobacteraceae bacterium]